MRNVAELVLVMLIAATVGETVGATLGAKEPLCEGDQHQVDCLLQQRFQDCKTNPDFSNLARPLLQAELQSYCRKAMPCYGLDSGLYPHCIGKYVEFLGRHKNELEELSRKNSCTDTKEYVADPARGRPVHVSADCACRVAAANRRSNGTTDSGSGSAKCDLDLACPAAFNIEGQGEQQAGLYQASCRPKSASCGDVGISECMSDEGKTETAPPGKGSAK